MSSTNSKQQLINAILEKKTPFLSVFFMVFLLSYALLAAIDFLPEPVSDSKEVDKKEQTVSDSLTIVSEDEESMMIKEDVQAEPVVVIENPILPHTLVIDSLDKAVPILNPTSRKVDDLDKALLDGTVRHPDSASLEQTGTVFILGHSSYLPTVHNRNFQALNGIQNLKWGDVLRLQADSSEYVYRVDRVYQATAKDTTVPIAGNEQRLVLATCNSFGSIDDRYMVEAELLEVRSI